MNSTAVPLLVRINQALSLRQLKGVIIGDHQRHIIHGGVLPAPGHDAGQCIWSKPATPKHRRWRRLPKRSAGSRPTTAQLPFWQAFKGSASTARQIKPGILSTSGGTMQSGKRRIRVRPRFPTKYRLTPTQKLWGPVKSTVYGSSSVRNHGNLFRSYRR